MTIKIFRNSLSRLRLDINELGVNNCFQPESVNQTCPFCPNVQGGEFHLSFNCPVYADIRYKYLRQFIVRDVELSFNSSFKNASIDASRKGAMFTLYALKHNEELLTS